MTFQWAYETRAHIDILRISGYVSFNAPDLVVATVGPEVCDSDRPLILDLTDMAGWGYVGRTAVVNAVSHLAAHRRVRVCAPHDKLTLWALRDSGFGDMIDADLDTALTSRLLEESA
ncbi:hypothetical protein [Nonomuraea sp. B19D2]|uniref:hypothetical protein n=1 Tax=Nonomuraea sp. B19D2 TaxID=3159561 RepID=UPI0032DAE09C